MRIWEIAKVRLSSNPDDYGAWVHDGRGREEPTVELPINRITTFEPEDKFQDPKNAENLKRIIKAIKAGAKLPPILVRRQGQGYQVIDGHHRFKAYRLLNKKTIPARIISKYNIKDQ